MTPTATTSGRCARLAVLALALTAGPGCTFFSYQHASLIHSRVSGGLMAGPNPPLRVGMPLRDATAYLESCGFRLGGRPENRPSTFPASSDTALHYVRVLPHPGLVVTVTHPEVHVLIFHDGNSVKDIKTETISTTVD